MIIQRFEDPEEIEKKNMHFCLVTLALPLWYMSMKLRRGMRDQKSKPKKFSTFLKKKNSAF